MYANVPEEFTVASIDVENNDISVSLEAMDPADVDSEVIQLYSGSGEIPSSPDVIIVDYYTSDSDPSCASEDVEQPPFKKLKRG